MTKIEKTELLKHNEKALSIIKNNSIGVVSTFNNNSLDLYMAPQSATTMAIVEDDFTLYFLTKTKSRKQYNIHSNPHISFVFSDLKTYETVQIEGTAVEITDDEVVLHYAFEIRKKISNRGRAFHPTEQFPRGKFTLYKCTPFWIRYGNFGVHPDNWESFETIRDEKRK